VRAKQTKIFSHHCGRILGYPPQKYGGIIVMRYKIQDEAEADVSLKTALDELYRDGLRGVLVIVSPRHYRVRSEQD
jgi:hypothetical protein